jgi:hypothetical protein
LGVSPKGLVVYLRKNQNFSKKENLKVEKPATKKRKEGIVENID